MSDVPPQAPPAPVPQEAPAFGGGGMPYFDPDLAFREEMERVYGPQNPEAHLVNRIHGTLEVHGAAIDRHTAEFERVREAHIEQRGYNTAMAGRVTEAEGRITTVEARVDTISGFLRDAWKVNLVAGAVAIAIMGLACWWLISEPVTNSRIVWAVVLAAAAIVAEVTFFGHFKEETPPPTAQAAAPAAPSQRRRPWRRGTQPQAAPIPRDPGAPATEQVAAVLPPPPPPPVAAPQANP